MYGTGTTLLPNGASLSIGAAVTHTLSRTLQVNSTTNWAAGDLQFISGALINNGIFNASSEAGLNAYGQAGDNVFVNNGTFNKNGGGLARFYVYNTGVAFNNNGQLNINAGTMDFSGYGTSTMPMTLAAGTTLSFGRDYAFSGASADINGPGALSIYGGTLTLDNSFTIESANVMLSAAIAGSGTTTFNGALTWSGGAMYGAGHTILANSASAAITGTNSKTLARTLDNHGTVDLNTGPTASLSLNNGTINNMAGATFALAAGSGIGNAGGINALNNAGVFSQSGSAASQVAVPLNNTATLQVQSGTLDLSSGGSYTGSFSLSGGAMLQFGGGTHILNAGANISGTGSLSITGGSVTDVAGVNVSGAASISGGSASFSGAFDVASLTMTGGALTLDGNPVINGPLSVGGSSNFALAANGNHVGHAQAVSTTQSGVVNVADNVVIVDYPPGDMMQSQQIQTSLTSGFNGGSWNGVGINSSIAHASSGTALGFAEATDLFTTFPATFAGQSVDDTTVLVRYTLYGDADLNRSVDTIDFNLLAANFSLSGKRWNQGDFDYNGSVDTIDFNLLASSFGKSLPGPVTSATSLNPPALARGVPSILFADRVFDSADLLDSLLS
jgi:hypothetical protein